MGTRTNFRLEMAPGALRRRTGFVVARLALLIRQRSSAKLRELGLTLQGYAVLCCLAEYCGVSQKDIAARTGIDPSDLAWLLGALHDGSRIFCDQDEADRRQDEVRLTGDGTRLVALASQALDEVEGELFRGLSTQERAVLRELAARVVADVTLASTGTYSLMR